VRLAVPLDQLLQHHRAGRHVDAQRERLGGEHRLDQPLDEQLLDDLLEGRQHAGVVCGDAALQAVQPVPVAEHAEVLARDRGGAALDDVADPLGLLGGVEPQLECRHCSTAAAQPARLKMKVMAGSRPWASSRLSTSGRLTTGRRWPPRDSPRPARPRAGSRPSSRASRSSCGFTFSPWNRS
jgi:hypothetical protein